MYMEFLILENETCFHVINRHLLRVLTSVWFNVVWVQLFDIVCDDTSSSGETLTKVEIDKEMDSSLHLVN
jgi:hypothetical protein